MSAQPVAPVLIAPASSFSDSTSEQAASTQLQVGSQLAEPVAAPPAQIRESLRRKGWKMANRVSYTVVVRRATATAWAVESQVAYFIEYQAESAEYRVLE